jgi:hypothetical protein
MSSHQNDMDLQTWVSAYQPIRVGHVLGAAPGGSRYLEYVNEQDEHHCWSLIQSSQGRRLVPGRVPESPCVLLSLVPWTPDALVDVVLPDDNQGTL